MRYEKGHKEETRRRIVDVASQRFRKDGIAATGLAGLMADAASPMAASMLTFHPRSISSATRWPRRL